jgi:hypothetical protein
LVRLYLNARAPRVWGGARLFRTLEKALS